MTKLEKQAEVDELQKKFSSSKVTVLLEINGLDVSEMTELRKKLRVVKGELRVVKNTLAQRASEGTPIASIRDSFQGPVAVTFGYDDPVAPARILKEFAGSRTEKIKMKIGVMEGQTLDPAAIKRVALLPKKEVLVGILMNRMQSPITGLVGGLSGIIRKMVYALAAVRDQKSTQ